MLNNDLIENNNEIIIYTTDDGQVDIEVRLEDKIVNIIKDDIPNWVVLRNKIRPGLVNIVPLYDYLNEYYLNYSYKYNIEEDIKPFIAGLNNLFGKLVEDEDFVYSSTHLQDAEEITEE